MDIKKNIAINIEEEECKQYSKEKELEEFKKLSEPFGLFLERDESSGGVIHLKKSDGLIIETYGPDTSTEELKKYIEAYFRKIKKEEIFSLIEQGNVLVLGKKAISLLMGEGIEVKEIPSKQSEILGMLSSRTFGSMGTQPEGRIKEVKEKLTKIIEELKKEGK